jgi:hypothetical protein
MSFVFDLLGDDFAENQLFGEVFGADDDAVGPRWTAGGQKKQRGERGDEFSQRDHREQVIALRFGIR